MYVNELIDQKITCFAMEQVLRITRAQTLSLGDTFVRTGVDDRGKGGDARQPSFSTPFFPRSAIPCHARCKPP